ncbi:MAG: hypothetical protein WD059_10680 [Balneolaceae bacterium]
MKKTAPFLIFLIFSLPIAVHAQMFSVDDDESIISDPFAPYLRAGIKMVDFTYTGNPDSPRAGNLNMSGIAAHLSFETGGFTLGASVANKLTGEKEQNYFDLELKFANPFLLIKSPNFIAGIPLQLSSKTMSVKSDNSSNEFTQTSLSAGLGVIAQAHFPQKLGAIVQFIPNYGFSSIPGGFMGGSVFTLNGKARLNFYNLIFNKNLSLGYNYTFNSFNYNYNLENSDIVDGQYDYDFTGHSLTIGISF